MIVNFSTIATVLTPVLVVLLGGAGWLITHQRQRLEEIEDQLSEKKYAAYIQLINIFFDVIKVSKSGNKPSEDLPTRMMDANKDLLIFGTDEVFLDYQAWTRSATEGEKSFLHRFANIILIIRRDMGHPNTKLTSDDVLRSLLTDFDQMRAEGRI